MSRPFKFKLSEKDSRYQRADEWFEFDAGRLLDETALDLEALEEAMPGTRIATVLSGLNEMSIVGLRGAFFLARRRAGVTESWATFSPRVLDADFQWSPESVEDDAVPPESSSPSPSDTSESETDSST